MFFTRLYDKQLAQASYIIGCQATGDAIVIDPNRDVAQYVAAARAERLRITHVTETHIHADFVSGARELASVAKARLLLSGDGGPDWQYAFAPSSTALLLHDGDAFSVGNIRFDVMHTPGHTPEHVSFVVTDTPASPQPLMILSGDFVFVGDVGRPDLLERAAQQHNTMEAAAHELWKSLQRFRALPDHLQLWPGHGAGSACGKALGAVPSSTVGYEKIANWALTAPSEAAFVAGVLDGQPEPPAYFANMKRVNKEGPALLGEFRVPPLIDIADLFGQVRTGAIMLDVRPAAVYAKGHVAGAISVPLSGSFSTYAGSMLPLQQPIVLIMPDDDPARARDVVRSLALIGFDDIVARATPASLGAAALHATLTRVAPADAIARSAQGVSIIDVRNSSEWAMEHIKDARHLPFTELAARVGEIPRGAPVMIMCQSGARSFIAASLLQRHGINALDAGGIVAWQRSGGAVETGAAH